MVKSFRDVVFFGANVKVAEAVQQIGDISTIITEKTHFSHDLYDFSQCVGAEFRAVERLSELSDLNEMSWDLGISCGLGLIFKSKHIERFEHGIWNIHYGPLPEVRGRHPISWAFLSDLPFGVTVHIIDEQIDRGTILVKEYVERNYGDTQIEIDEKIEKVIRSGLLQRAVDSYQNGEGYEAPEGKLYPSLAGVYENIEPADHDSKFVYNLFKSQFIFGGVRVREKQYLRCKFFCAEYSDSYAGWDIWECSDGVKVALSEA